MAYYYQYGIVVLMIVLAVVSAGFNFGYNNSYTCHCEDNTRCNTVTGDCSNGCFEGWGAPICQQENIALHSDFVKSAHMYSYRGPKRAVDGINKDPCSFIDSKEVAWWFIDLQQQYSLRYMTLDYYVFVGHSAQHFSVSVHIDDELCSLHSDKTSGSTTEHPIDCGRTFTGRSVNISFNIPHWDGDDGFVALCEVEIFVCARGTYGSNCNHFCHCSNLEDCDVKTGKCSNGCQLGWYGDNCNTAKCDDGYYILGESCVRCTCGDNCNSDTGVCDGECHEHCIDQKCDDMKRCTEGCSVGYYGDYCDLPCHSNCNSNICDGNGNCIKGCIDGYHGRTCDKLCPVNCTRCNITGDCLKCIKPWYGDACNKQCLDCVNGNCHANGTCINGCFNGRYGELCQYNCSSVCKRPNNNTNICQQITGKCIAGCRDGIKGHLCKEVEATRPEPAIDSPTTDSPTTDSPTTDSPTTDSPTTDSLTTDSPSTDLQTTDSPTTDSPATDSPTTDSPTTDSPTTDSPTTDSPTTDSPTTDSPTTYSTTTEGIMCKQSTDSRNTTWQPTTAGTTSTIRCGDDYEEGMSRRHCSEAGIWSQPDYSDCKRSKLVALKNITDGVIEGKLGTPPNETLQMLVELTADGPQLAAGDVEVSVQILKDVVAITNNDSQVVIKKPELQSFAQSASNILDADGDEWKTLAEQGKSGIAVMMDIVDSMAKLGSSRLENNETITASTDKMIIEIGRSSLSDIEFPRPASSDYPDWLTQSSNKVVLRKESFGEQNISYNAVFYNDISKIVEGRILNPGETIDSKSDKTVDINSKILAVSINPPPVGKLDPPIELSFQHLSDNYSVSTCVFLDLKPPYDKRGRWSTEGCKTESTSNPNVTICKCDHLTNFAILMSPGRTSIKHREVLSIISAVGCVISICCLLFTVFVYGYFWRYVKSDKAIILMNLCVTLIIAYIIFLGGVTRTDSKALCQTVAVLLHFFFLAVFFLMLAEGVQVLISVVALAMKSRLKWILSASWGIPTILVIISMSATRLHGYGNDNYCWLSLESGLLWAFVGPALAVILANLIIVVKVLTVMFSTTTMVTKSMKEKGRTGLKALCVLLPIIGLTWVFGVFSVNGYTVVFQYLFAIFNSLQGLFIFIFHCVLNRQVNEAVKIRRRRYRAKSIDTGTGTKSSSFPMQSNQTRSMSDSDKPTNVPDEKKSPVQEAECQVHPQP